METEVAVALLGAGGAVVVAVIAAVASVLSVLRSATAQRQIEEWKDERARASKDQDRQYQAKVVLDQYRRPLMAAADDLGHRINNIRTELFFDRYVSTDDRRRELALRATLFRFAKYFGWVEALDRRLIYLDFEAESNTKSVAVALRNVAGTLASDEYGTTMMLWREEQRAVGGLMQQSGESPAVLGFEGFQQLYEDRFAPWLATFATELQDQAVASSARLAELQENLATLVTGLDQEGLHADTRDWWLRNTRTQGGDQPGRGRLED